MTIEKVDELRDEDCYSELALPPILDAALHELRDNGYHGTTVRKIVNRAGLTMPALYYHYGNKEGVLVALLHVAMDELGCDLRTTVDPIPSSDPEARLRGFVSVVINHVTRRRALAALHRENMFLSPDERRRYVSRRREVSRLLQEILVSGMEAGVFHFDDPATETLAILGMLQSVTDWFRPHGRLSVDDIAVQYESIVLQAVGIQ